MSDPAAWVSAIAASVSSLSVLGAGGFAYFRFYRARVQHADLGLTVTGTLHQFGSSRSITARITVKNTGSFRMFISPNCLYQLTVERLDQAMWDDAQAYGDVLWTEGQIATVDLMTEEGVRDKGIPLEPVATTDQSVVVPLPRDDGYAYKLTVRVTAEIDAVGRRKQEPGRWTSHTLVVPRSGDERSTDPLRGEDGAVVALPEVRQRGLVRWLARALPSGPRPGDDGGRSHEGTP